MNPPRMEEHVAAQSAAGEALRSPGSIEDELTEIAEDLAALRDLYATYDPDSPPW